MLLFDVYHKGQPAKTISLDGANLIGAEGVPVRAEIAAEDGQISCLKPAPGAAALSVLWDAGEAGRLLLKTTRLPERKEPYNLNLELARSRITVLIRKREDWGLIGFPSGKELEDRFIEIRKLFLQAVKVNADDAPAASKLADDCLAQCVALSEQTAIFHADIFLSRRRKINRGRPTFGCEVSLDGTSHAHQQRVLAAADFINLPTPWKQIEPQEGEIRLTQLDTWVEWCLKHRIPLSAGPLVSFEPDFFPESIYIYEHDFETLRDMIYEHIQKLVSRYANRVATWKVISAAHAFNNFNLSFEQIIELTRMTCSAVRNLAPKASIAIELAMPWGEYSSSNPRTMPPMMYVDMCVQSGINFDSFGVQVYMGAESEGMFVRDMMQVSAKLDDFATFGKPVHVSGCAVPSAIASDPTDHWRGKVPVDGGGVWRQPWSPEIQADWLEHFYRLALSKPFVATVCWRDLTDGDGHYFPHGGLCATDMEPKPAYERLRMFRAAMNRRPTKATGRAATDPPAKS